MRNIGARFNLENEIEKLFKRYENTDPIKNPIRYQYNRNYNGPLLGDKGKLYLKRGRMNDGLFYNKTKISYAVPAVWEKPKGFKHDGVNCWITNSDLIAMRHFRYAKNAKPNLIKLWKNQFAKQDYIYNLSKAVDSNIELPQLPNTFQIRPHQKVGIEFGKITNGNFIIADQQRTGKSYTALLYVLSETWDKCLIICPSKVIPIWANQTPFNRANGMIRNISNLPINVLNRGSTLSSGFNVVSYDTIHTIDELDCDICIADEAHFFLEQDARRSKAVNKVISPKKIALTGTPVMNNINDIVSIVRWINKDLADELQPLVDDILTEESYIQAKIIGDELKRRCLLLRETSQVGTTVEPYINFIELELKINDSKNIQEVGKAKVNYAVEYLKSFKNKILVAFYHKEVGQMLKARLGNKAILVNGDTSKDEVRMAIDSFRDSEVQYFLGSTVIAEGLDFSFCNHIVMLEESSYSMRTDQIRERCNNIYKNEEVILDVFIALGTQDERVYEYLYNKFSLNKGIRDA